MPIYFTACLPFAGIAYSLLLFNQGSNTLEYIYILMVYKDNYTDGAVVEVITDHFLAECSCTNPDIGRNLV